MVLLLGLPDWLWQGAIALVALGIPIVLAADWLAGRRRGPWLTRRRALAAGGVALLLTVLSGAGYLGSRAFGVGPFATPISRGQLQAQARVVLADFAPIGVDTRVRQFPFGYGLEAVMSPSRSTVAAGVVVGNAH